MKSCIIHLGSNKGDRAAFLQQANELINQDIGELQASSKIYETSAWGMTEQHDFLNQAIKVITRLSPFEVLEKISMIESHMGRVKSIKWGPREIDIDIIFFEDLILHSSTLEIPHPHYHKRRFVLIPLLEIDPNLIDPQSNMTISEIEKKCTDTSKVIEYIGA